MVNSFNVICIQYSYMPWDLHLCQSNSPCINNHNLLQSEGSIHKPHFIQINCQFLTSMDKTVANRVTMGGTVGNTTCWNSWTNPPVITAPGDPLVQPIRVPVKNQFHVAHSKFNKIHTSNINMKIFFTILCISINWRHV